MSPDAENVRLLRKTGSDRRTAKAALLTGRALQEVSSTWQMRSCINVSGWTGLERAIRVTSVRKRREDRSSIVVSSSRRPRRVRGVVGYVIDRGGALNTLAVADEIKRVSANGTDFAYVEIGQGEPVIFVHGGLQDYRMWIEHLPKFAVR